MESAEAPPADVAKENIREQWAIRFKQAVQYDTWGQIVEAQEEYKSLAQNIAIKQSKLFPTSRDKDMLHRLIMCLSARVEALEKALTGTEPLVSNEISSSDMLSLEAVIKSLFSNAEDNSTNAFPLHPVKFYGATPIQPLVAAEGEILCCEKNVSKTSDFYNSHQAITSVKGTVVQLRLDKIGLKDAQYYIDPSIAVLVVDQAGQILDNHDISTSNKGKMTHISFNQIVYLGISFEDMHACNATVFIEFKHFKPKKKKISTRCWTFMELAEMKRDEEVVLELYAKPTDLRKKKLKLHTEKQLYMHLFVTFIRP